jgi:hypothetical protein
MPLYRKKTTGIKDYQLSSPKKGSRRKSVRKPRRRCSRGRKIHSPRKGLCRKKPGPKKGSRRKSVRKPRRRCSRGRKIHSPRKGLCRKKPGPKRSRR